MTLPRRILLAAAAALAAAPAARADEPVVSTERARAAVTAGLIRPLAELLRMIERRYLGQVIEADLHEKDGHWTYEFELLPPDGHLFVIHLDAATGAVDHVVGPVQERN